LFDAIFHPNKSVLQYKAYYITCLYFKYQHDIPSRYAVLSGSVILIILDPRSVSLDPSSTLSQIYVCTNLGMFVVHPGLMSAFVVSDPDTSVQSPFALLKAEIVTSFV
jgi:hypothetical protein